MLSEPLRDCAVVCASPAQFSFDQGSFRDRTARVFTAGNEVYRILNSQGLQNWQHVCGLSFVENAMQSGQLVRTRCVEARDWPTGTPAEDANTSWCGLLQHERVPLISYPYEWCFSMLKEAALLQLHLMQQALAENVILKDASPFNIQFRGTKPLFIDIPSFTPLRQGEPWDGYRQFCQMFLFPLMLQAYRGVDFQPWMRGKIDGISPSQMAGLLSSRDLLRAGVFTHVKMHAWLYERQNRMSAEPAVQSTPAGLQAAGFEKSMIENNVRGLQRIVKGLEWRCQGSLWSDYDSQPSPAHTDGHVKEQFVAQILATRHWRCVWDIGCNRGRYSRLAAERSDLVVAMDSDHFTIEQFYLSLRERDEQRIVPLVFNLADPTPGLGWRGAERSDLVGRSQPDMILCLAVIHHLVFRENLQLPDVIHWLAERNAELIIEFTERADPQVQSLLADRVDQFSDYSWSVFIRELSRRFEIRSEVTLPSASRRLVHAIPRSRSDQ